MDNYELILSDIKAILETVDEVNNVSHGHIEPLDSEDTFTSVYITPEMDSFDLYKAGAGPDAYTNIFYVKLTVNMDCTDSDLLWTITRRKVIDAILHDKAIWTNIVDRDIVSIAHDDYANHPRKTFAMLFEFRLREACII